jgi:hypothetical protein
MQTQIGSDNLRGRGDDVLDKARGILPPTRATHLHDAYSGFLMQRKGFQVEKNPDGFHINQKDGVLLV